MDDEAALALMSVAPEYLGAALAAIEDKHGGIDPYLEAVLGVGPQQRAAIRNQLLT
jgi:hypothetical protein